MKIVTWDWKEQPPWAEIAVALEATNRGTITAVETGTQDYAVVIHKHTGAAGRDAIAQAYYDQHAND